MEDLKKIKQEGYYLSTPEFALMLGIATEALIDKKIVFDNLYTGYEAQVFRYPIDQYNRDIIIYLNMFGYKYKNS